MPWLLFTFWSPNNPSWWQGVSQRDPMMTGKQPRKKSSAATKRVRCILKASTQGRLLYSSTPLILCLAPGKCQELCKKYASWSLKAVFVRWLLRASFPATQTKTQFMMRRAKICAKIHNKLVTMRKGGNNGLGERGRESFIMLTFTLMKFSVFTI